MSSIKLNLTKTAVQKLNTSILPVADASGNLIGTEPNPSGKAYLVIDINKKSPSGFGLYVGKKVKTFVMQVRVGGHVKRITVGEYGPLTLTDGNPEIDARTKASQLREQLKAGSDVRAVKKTERVIRDTTFADIFENYVSAYKRRPVAKQKDNSLLAMKSARTRLKPWLGLSVRAIGTKVVQEIWAKICNEQGHRTAAEQTLMWSRAAFNLYLEERASDANLTNGGSTVLINPFSYAKKLARTRDELELEYRRRNVRNPISNTREGLGVWLDAVWHKRSTKQTAADYLLTTLLVGARRNETATTVWSDRAAKDELERLNIVDVKNGIIRLNETKNHNTHEVPLGNFLWDLLKKRHAADDGKYVFPVVSESKLSKRPYYSDPRSMIDSLSGELDKPYRLASHQQFMKDRLAESGKTMSKKRKSELEEEFSNSYLPHFTFSMHDLRRTFISVASSTDGVPYAVVKRLANHSTKNDVTAMYIKYTLDELRRYMQKVEDALLSHAGFLGDVRNGAV